MANKRTDIAQIRKYLNGELDARAMHKLEREAQDDPFLMEALQGFERKGKDPAPELHELKHRLAERVNKDRKKRVLLWPTIYMAASVLIFAAIGGWWLIHRSETAKNNQMVVHAAKPKVTTPPPVQADSVVISQAPVIAEHKNVKPVPSAVLKPTESPAPQAEAMAVAPEPVSARSDVKEVKPELEDKLKGQVAGVELKQNAEGENVNIRIRGTSAIKEKEPLYVVDGVPTDSINHLKQGDVADMHVLKDASSSALYGSRGSNGVIVITTRQGAAHIAAVKRDSADKARMLQEAVVTGYVAQKKQTLTGAAASVSVIRQDTSQKALEGRAAGVQLAKSKRSKDKANNNPDSARLVRGRVIGKDDNQPLVGASVRVLGTNNGTQTDVNGNYTIKAKNDNQLVFAYIGYKAQQQLVGKRDQVNVTLEVNGSALNEVVVVGYGEKHEDGYVAPIINAHPAIGWKEFDQRIKDHTAPDGKKGKVRVKFTVNADGSLTDFKVTKSLSPEDDAEAIRLIQQTPWTPRSNGEAETMRVTVKFIEKR